MKYVSPLSDVEVTALEDMHCYQPSAHVRVRARAHMIILSHRSYRLQEIASIRDVTRQTVSQVISTW